MSDDGVLSTDERIVEIAWALKDIADEVALLPATAAPLACHINVAVVPEGFQVNLLLRWQDEAGREQAYVHTEVAPTMQWATSRAALAMRRFTENLEEQAEVGPIDTKELGDG